MIYLQPGDRHPIVAEVKKKLGMWPIDENFTPDLTPVIRGRQRLWGQDETGLIDDALLRKIRTKGPG